MQKTFIAVNFAALTESLLESELFGYEEGAFTGAKKGGMSGLFQQAHKGTIFLDEIGDAPLSFQVKLLRVLQEKQVRRIGSSRVIPIDIRVIVATNKNLKEFIDQRLFRQDLYYRLNVLPMKLPPLRERKQDILILAKHFYRKYFTRTPLLPSEVYFRKIEEFFLAYNWPGNIRELQNVVEYLVNICPNYPPDEGMLPEELKEGTHLLNPATEPSLIDPLPAGIKYSLRNFPANSLIPTELITENQKSLILLQLIVDANAQGQPVGRRSLALKTGLTEGVVRGLLENLDRKGYLITNRGRKGLVLTNTGKERILNDR